MESEQNIDLRMNTDAAQESNNIDRPWDHTNRKVVVYNIPKFMKPKDVDSLVSSWSEALSVANIKIHKCKKPHNSNWLNVTLESETMVDDFLGILNSGNCTNKKGGVLSAKRARDKGYCSNNEKRSRDIEDDKEEVASGETHKKQKPDDDNRSVVKSEDEVRDAITPLWRLSYEMQLNQKAREMVNKCLMKIVSEVKSKIYQELRRSDHDKQTFVYDWIKEKRPIEMDKILGAPRHMKYRNKCELTFGYLYRYTDESLILCSADAEVKENDTFANNRKRIAKVPAVGFVASGWSGGVSLPHCLPTVPDEVCGIVDVVNKFLQDSPIPPYDTRYHRGVWRQMTVRVSQRTSQCMVIIQHGPSTGGAGKREDGSDDYSHVFDKEKLRLVEMLTSADIPIPTREASSNDVQHDFINVESTRIRVTSLFFQEYDGLSQPTPDHPVQHIFGSEYIEEKLLQCVFCISPGAFFQVSTEGAEVLYQVIIDKVREVTQNPKDTLLFDICCGTGTIGLTCMKEGVVGRVVGVDLSQPAIKNAIHNAEQNGYAASSSATFIAARAESVMSDEVRKASNAPVIAVVDPARDGLHQDVLRAIRNSRVQRLIYVSCNPTGSLIRDAAILCSPPSKKYYGLPFKPTSAHPVDMFPHTAHCEMVLVFDRMSNNECSIH